MNRLLLFTVLIYSLIVQTQAQNIAITDTAFKSCLLSIADLNTNNDDEIQLSEAQSFTGEIDCEGKEIADVTGLTSFVNITELNLRRNQIESIDLSQLIELNTVELYLNELATLDVSNNTKLKKLECDFNDLSSIDLSNNLLLEDLDCGVTNITSLSLSHLPKLRRLRIEGNNMSSLDVTQNLELNFVTMHETGLSEVDFSKNTELENLVCFDNEFTELDLSKNINLRYLSCGENNLAELDVSTAANLWYLKFNDNDIKSIDLSKNYKLTTIDASNNGLKLLNLTNNPLLSIVEIASNEIEFLDLSKNEKIVEINFEDNLLNCLDLSIQENLVEVLGGNNPNLEFISIANGNNENLIDFDLLSNPNLTCIQVDEAIPLNNIPSTWLSDSNPYSYICDVCSLPIIEYLESGCDSIIAPNGETYYCSGSYYDTNSPVGSDSIVNYIFDIPQSTSSELIEITTEASYIGPSGVVYTESGDYIDVILNEAGCDSFIHLNLTIEGFIIIEQQGSELTVNVTGANYQWLDCANGFTPISGATDQVFSPDNAGSYAVSIIGEPSDTSECYSYLATSINQLQAKNFNITPNPVIDKFTIQLDREVEGLQYHITNLSGQLVLKPTTLTNNTIKVNFNVPSGIYFINFISNDGQTISNKIIKN